MMWLKHVIHRLFVREEKKMEKEYCKCMEETRMGILYTGGKRYCTRCSKELEDVDEGMEEFGTPSSEGIRWPTPNTGEL